MNFKFTKKYDIEIYLYTYSRLHDGRDDIKMSTITLF